MRIHLIRRTGFQRTVYGGFFGNPVSPLFYSILGWALSTTHRNTQVSHGQYTAIFSKFPKNRSMRWILIQAPWRPGITGGVPPRGEAPPREGSSRRGGREGGSPPRVPPSGWNLRRGPGVPPWARPYSSEKPTWNGGVRGDLPPRVRPKMDFYCALPGFLKQAAGGRPRCGRGRGMKTPPETPLEIGRSWSEDAMAKPENH